MIVVLVFWIVAAIALAFYALYLHARLSVALSELRGANYRAAAGWNAWEAEKYRRTRPDASYAAEGYDIFTTVDELTRAKP